MPPKGLPEWQEINVQHGNKPPCLVISFVNHDLRSPTIIRGIEHDFVRLVKVAKVQKVIVDFTNVKVMPTAILGLVLQLVTDGREKSIKVRLCSMNPMIRKAFDLLNLKGMVDIFDDRKAAILSSWEEKRRGWWQFWR